MKHVLSAFAALCLTAAMPLPAQTLSPSQARADAAESQDEELPPSSQPEVRPPEPGRVADSAVGEVGQRDLRGRAPIARIASRIQNRVQTRLRSRIDRNYDPQINATDPFVTAQDQARTAGRSNP